MILWQNNILIFFVLFHYVNDSEATTSCKLIIHRREMEEDFIKEICSNKPVIFVFGPTNIGKSFLAKNYFSNCLNLKYADMRNTEIVELVERDTNSFLDTYQIIDSLESHSPILPEIYRRIENNSNPCQYILITSNYFTLKCEDQLNDFKMANFIALKTKQVHIHPLTLNERSSLLLTNDYNKNSTDRLLSAIVQGGFPEAVVNKNSVQFYKAYIESELSEAYKQYTILLNIDRLNSGVSFGKIFESIAQSAGQFFNEDNVRGNYGLRDKQMTEIINFLKDKFLIKYIYKFDYENNVKSSDKKIFLTDVGLLCYLMEKNETDLYCDSIIGSIFENFVFTELETALRRNWFLQQIYLWHYEDKETNKIIEIDFLFQYKGCIYLFDVKFSSSKVYTEPFKVFTREYANKYKSENIKKYAVYYLTKKKKRKKIKTGDNDTDIVNLIHIYDLSSTIDNIFKK